MVKSAARKADVLASKLPETDPEKPAARARIARLGNECGCAAGGAFLIAASLLFVTYAILFGQLSVRLVVLGATFVFASSMLGKLAGILTAVVRLAALRRRLADRVEGMGDAPPPPVLRGA